MALSRAREGLYILGNADDLTAKSKMWKGVVAELERHDQIGEAFPIGCQRHPDRVFRVSSPGQLPLLAPDGESSSANNGYMLTVLEKVVAWSPATAASLAVITAPRNAIQMTGSIASFAASPHASSSVLEVTHVTKAVQRNAVNVASQLRFACHPAGMLEQWRGECSGKDNHNKSIYFPYQ